MPLPSLRIRARRLSATPPARSQALEALIAAAGLDLDSLTEEQAVVLAGILVSCEGQHPAGIRA